MQAYLVGGAVRDRLLGADYSERDWVVVGSTPEQMIAAGYRQVGASFPVFLHPETGEEYALARTERKQGSGYHGFSVDFHPDVTLEEDLCRRDLTINAMAMDDAGTIIDPFDGQGDLERKLLRHVSPAFAEDPLRVLRLARFAARFSGLGFTIDAGTLEMARELSGSGELAALVPERVWQELEKALAGSSPGQFIATLRDCAALVELWPEIDCLYGIPQPARYHPEIDTGIHLQMTLDTAAAMNAEVAVVFACLLHDLGKGVTPLDMLPAHRGHERSGVPLVDRFCERIKAPNRMWKLARAVCEYHLHAHRALELKPATLLRVVEALDGVRNPGQFEWFVQACEADFRGRGGRSGAAYPQADYLREVRDKVAAVSVADLAGEGLKGPQIADRLRRRRLAALGEMGVDPGHEELQRGQ